MGRIKAVIMRYRDATGAKASEVPSLKDMPAWMGIMPTDEQIREEGCDGPDSKNT